MLFLNVLLFCLVGTPVLAASIPQGNLQIRSPGPQPDGLGPRDGRLIARASRVARAWPKNDRLGRRAGNTPDGHLRWQWPKGTSPDIKGTWYMSPEKLPNNAHWTHYVIELDLSNGAPIVSVLGDKPGELKRIGPIPGSEDEILEKLSAGPWRRMPYHKGFNADDRLIFSRYRGFKLEHGMRIAPGTPPPISDQIHAHVLTGFRENKEYKGNPKMISGLWYGIENDNRNIIMEIHPDDLSLTFSELPDGAEAVKEIKVKDVKKRGVGTWRRMPLNPQISVARSDELIVRTQKDELYFDFFREPIQY